VHIELIAEFVEVLLFLVFEEQEVVEYVGAVED
jgi:hypothetical protein